MKDSTAQGTDQPAFGKLRAFFWPIYNFELKKLLPMLLLFFLILFNYTILRDTKDTLVVTSCGAEAIPFLKVYGVLPLAVLFMVIYSKLSNKLSKSKLFYTTVSPFIIFFALFALVLYPAREYLQPDALADTLKASLSSGFSGLIETFRNWISALFYVMAELWGSVCLSLLFWGFANDITKVSESKRFYNLFGLGANVSLLIAGTAIVWVSDLRKNMSAASGVDPWQVSLNWLMGMVVLSGLLILGTYWWINKYVLTDERFYSKDMQRKMKGEKPKMGFFESLKMLSGSKYIGCIAIIVIAYGMCINLVEVTWKSQLKLAYPTPNEYSTFMGNFSRITGLVTMLMMFFVTGNVVRKLGWTFAALITPVILMISGAAFFGLVLYGSAFAGLTSIFSVTPLMLAVFFGTFQNIASKSSKYSLFDPTKEMTYIPLDQDTKVKGKAAIDVVGARFGKSGGALIQQALIIGLGSIGAITPYIAVILFVLIGAWIIAAKSLGGQFKVANAKMEAENKKEEEAVQTEPAAVKGELNGNEVS